MILLLGVYSFVINFFIYIELIIDVRSIGLRYLLFICLYVDYNYLMRINLN